MISGKLWNIIYEVKRQKIKRNRVKFVSSGNISPYMELNFENINYLYFDEKSINEIEVNPYYRYFEIFSEMLYINSEDYPQIKEILFDVMCHYLAELELKKGLTMEDYLLKFISKSIFEKEFGERISKEFEEVFDEAEKKKIHKIILNMYRDGSCMEHYCKALGVIFKNSIVYNYKDTEEDLIIYIGHKEREKNIRKHEILKDIFLPISINIFVFWEHHFLVIGQDGVSMIDESRIF